MEDAQHIDIDFNPEFDNSKMSTAYLPDVLTVDYEKLAPSYRTYSLVAATIGFGIFAVVVFFILIFTDQLGIFQFVRMLIFLGTMIVLYIIRMCIKYYGYSKKAYALRRHDVLYKSGIWWKRHVFVPKNRIQHVEIKKTPLEDIFGISRLMIFTAGGSGSDLVIPGLLPENAERIKENLMQKIAHDQEE